MHALVRHVSGSLHPFEIAFFRSLFGLAVVLPLLYRAGPSVFRSHNPKLILLRGALGGTSMLCWFYGLSVVPIAEATALSFTNVIFGSLGVTLILGERMRARRWTAIAFGFAGMLLILKPGIGVAGTGSLIVLFAAVLWGISTVVVKKISQTDSTLTIVAWSGLALTVVTAIPAATVWQWPNLEEYLWLVLIGTIGSIGNMGWTYAIKTAEASLIIPIDFSRLVWAAAIGFLFFAELPDIWTWSGSALIVSSTAYISWREARLSKA